MTFERRGLRGRTPSEHSPNKTVWWLARLTVFLLAFLTCSGATLVLCALALQTDQIVGSIDFGRVQSIDQLAINLYLRVREGDVSLRSSGSGSVPFSVQPGDTAGTVGVRLQRAGLIADAELFRLLARARDVESHLEVGDYQLQRGMSMDEILTALQSGRVKSNSVRLIEGWRIEEMAAAAEKQGAGTAAAFVAAAKAGSYKFAFLSDRPKGSTLEGFLFPDTYDVPSNATAEQIIGFALTNFDQKVGRELWGQASSQGLSPYQRLIVASIVEREARMADERPLIASVYINRLKRNMRLEADPTVQYAMGYQAKTGSWWKTPVALEEYSNILSPYNTYLNDSLPPSPICSPGLSAIRAAFDPAKTDYLFFLARGDGTHVFAKTFEEHQANIAKYQK